jgi:hypothetical protein
MIEEPISYNNKICKKPRLSQLWCGYGDRLPDRSLYLTTTLVAKHDTLTPN